MDRVAERKRMAKVGLGDVRTSQLPDDVILLQVRARARMCMHLLVDLSVWLCVRARGGRGRSSTSVL